MENTNCIKCGNPQTAQTLRFVAVNQSSSSSTRYSGRKQITTTTTTEQLAGVERASFCADCIKKERVSTTIWNGVAGLFAGFGMPFFLMLIFSGKKFFNAHAGTIALVCLGIGVIVSICTAIFGWKTSVPELAAKILGKVKKGPKYIPVDPGIYKKKPTDAVPDLETFKSKTGLKTNVGLLVFTQFIATGLGDALVDAMLLQNSQTAPENGKPIPESGNPAPEPANPAQQ